MSNTSGADTLAVIPLLLLHPEDNVLVCVATIAAGQSLAIDGQQVSSPQAVDVGHKVARRALAVGERIFKYGAPIGSVITDVAIAEHLHLHNMQSDYIPSHTRVRQERNPY